MTAAQFRRNVQAAIDAKMAHAAVTSIETQVFNLNAAEVRLERAALAQKAYWNALAELERELGFEIEANDLGELSAYTVRDLYNKFA